MIILEKSMARESLANYVDRVKNEMIVVTEEGKPVAALTALDDVDLETVTLSTNPQFAAIIQHSRQRDTAEGRLSSAEVRKLFSGDQQS